MVRRNIADYLDTETLSPADEAAIAFRASYLETCTRVTRRYHLPILKLSDVRGHLNPAGLGRAAYYSKQGSLGQSSTAFVSLAAYREADRCGRAVHYGGASYGVVRTPEVEAVCSKIAAAQDARGALICNSGLAAITTTIDAFRPKLVVVPDNIYGPTPRYLDHRRIPSLRYPSRGSGAEVRSVLETALRRCEAAEILLFMEGPGSGTFEICDIDAVAQAAADLKVRSVFDASWGRFKPLDHGIKIGLAATTKWAGYGDTPSGAVFTSDLDDFKTLGTNLHYSGHGTVTPATCARLFHRLDSFEERWDRHYRTGLALSDLFEAQDFIKRVHNPALPRSPDHARFKKYFGAGQGLFSVEPADWVTAQQMDAFCEQLRLFRVAESWGTHVSLVEPLHPNRQIDAPFNREIVRFHAGLESLEDLKRDVLEAGTRVFGSVRDVRPRPRGSAALAAAGP